MLTAGAYIDTVTDEEAQHALDQQLPVMWRPSTAATWHGPGVLTGQHFAVLFTDTSGATRHEWAFAKDLRLATAHELLTADEGAQ